MQDIGAITGSDEYLNHQIVDTFASVAESDLAWTEKIWASIAKTDGSLQIDFGLGKYQNRGIIDGFGGISRGREQWTVRGSRELRSAPDEVGIGPIQYEVIEPLRRVRVRLEPNDVQPISFDIELSAVTPPFFEDRNLSRNKRTGRVDVNVIRYHQGGWASGTVTIDGATHEVRPEEWFGFRDHSWGVRQSVGAPPSDLIQSAPRPERARAKGAFKWMPAFFGRPDGSYYETAMHVIDGGPWDLSSAYMNEANGMQALVRNVESRMTFDPRTRFVRGGELLLTMQSGEQRLIEVEALGESGFFLKPVGYGPWKGHIHGTWQGREHFDGEHLADCWDDEHLPLLGQLRDTPVRVREGDAVGYGIMESIITGEWPDLGLTSESDHATAYA